MKWLGRTACALGVAAALGGCMRDENFESKKYLLGDENFGVRPLVAFSPVIDSMSESPAEEAYNLPEEFRREPKHPDDGWTGSSSAPTIPDDSLFLPKGKHRRSFFKFGVEASFFDRIGLDVYGGVDEIKEEEGFPYAHDDPRGEVNEVNYSNNVGSDQRGYGAALFGCAANFKGGHVPRINADLILKLTKGEWINHNLLVGMGLVKYEVEEELFYDRYNKLQHIRTRSLGDVVEEEVYMAYRATNEHETLFFDLKFGKRGYDFNGKGGVKMRFDNDSEDFVSASAGVAF